MTHVVTVHSQFVVAFHIYIYFLFKAYEGRHTSRPCGRCVGCPSVVLSVPKLDLSIIIVHILSRDIESAYIAYWTLFKCAQGCVVHCLLWLWHQLSTCYCVALLALGQSCDCLVSEMWFLTFEGHHTSRPQGHGVGCPWFLSLPIVGLVITVLYRILCYFVSRYIKSISMAWCRTRFLAVSFSHKSLRRASHIPPMRAMCMVPFMSFECAKVGHFHHFLCIFYRELSRVHIYCMLAGHLLDVHEVVSYSV